MIIDTMSCMNFIAWCLPWHVKNRSLYLAGLFVPLSFSVTCKAATLASGITTFWPFSALFTPRLRISGGIA